MNNILNIDALKPLELCSDGFTRVGEKGVEFIGSTHDDKVEFIFYKNNVFAFVNSALGYPAYYKVNEVCLKRPVKAVLMDLDGTSIKSEAFWIWIIQKTISSLLSNSKFELEDADIPYVSGNSVSEHLKYCINKYCPDASLEETRGIYFKHTHNEMDKISKGRGRKDAFLPTPGLKDFLCGLKSKKIKVGLVTSGLYEKAWPAILSVFRSIGLGDPKQYYDSIITAGWQPVKGQVGTLGELEPKPHPWLYAETAAVGLGIPFEQRNHIIGIEDSSAGICSIRLAGFYAIGIDGGNIITSGAKGLCNMFCESFEPILRLLFNDQGL